MELQEGMYVRTEWGIGKYIKDYTNSQNLTWRVLQGCSNYDNQEDWENLFCDSEILKASYNIIDLIEVGDYVNGGQVIGRDIINQEDNVYTIKGRYGTYFKNSDIKSIVTKEQFESMQYNIQ